MTLNTATSGSEVFLQNGFLSIGINSSGGLGSTHVAPAGIATDVRDGYKTVGMYGDFDGFNSGKPSTVSESILQGVAIEGFNIGYKTGGKTHVASNQELDGLTQIKGHSGTASTATEAAATWSGDTQDNLHVDQKISLVDGAKYVRVDVTLTNDSSAAMTDVRYMRTADPDLGSSFTTDNRIVDQGHGEALVASYTTGGTNPYFLYANDPRAVASTYGFIDDNPYAPTAYDTPQAQGYHSTKDLTDNLTFGLGTLDAGKSVTITFYMGLTDDLDATIAAIHAHEGSAPPPPVIVPHAVDDVVSVSEGDSVNGNVLSNDTDGSGHALSATLKTGPEHGSLTLNADGSFTYTAAADYVGTDSFTYTASNGAASDVGKVTVTTTAATPPAGSSPPATMFPSLPDSATLQRAGTVDGSTSTSDTLTGKAHNNSFYFDIDAKSGKDQISNFTGHDVLVTTKALYDSNGDGIINFKGALKLDGSASGDTVAIPGETALRSLGHDDKGLFVYADASVRPKGAIEGTLQDDKLHGDSRDHRTNKFFFDTGLSLDLGHDSITNFGKKDVVITTVALDDSKVGGTVHLDDTGSAKLVGADGTDLGSFSLTDNHGSVVHSIEFDGSVEHNGTTYYVYSQVGSSAGVGTLGF